MYSFSVMGKSVPGMEALLASPFVRSVLGSSSITFTTLWTMTLLWSDGLSNTMTSPTLSSPNGWFPCTMSTSYTSSSGTMLPLATT